MEAIIRKHKICAILRHIPLDNTLDYAQALYQGGIRMFEVATNSDCAYEQIRRLRATFGDKAWIGAGTVINQERCEKSLEAGAHFFLTPSTTIATMVFCQKNNIPLLPGVMTPTDVSICLEYGHQTMKLFPAGDLPPKYVTSLQGPFSDTSYVAVGGVNIDNMLDFFHNGFIGVGIGSNLIPKEYISNSNWEQASIHVKKIIDKLSNN